MHRPRISQANEMTHWCNEMDGRPWRFPNDFRGPAKLESTGSRRGPAKSHQNRRPASVCSLGRGPYEIRDREAQTLLLMPARVARVRVEGPRVLEQLTVLADSIAKEIGSYLAALVGIGALSMAVVQTIKELTAIRGWFHQRRFDRWFADCGRRACLNAESVLQARTTLIDLATAGDSKALFDLDVDRMAGQLAAAATVVIDYPGQHPETLQCLAVSANPADITAVLEASTPGRELLDRPSRDKAARGRHQAAADSKARLAHQVLRNIDGFQISTGFRWKWALQLVSFGVSYALTLVGLLLTPIQPDGAPLNLITSIPLAFAAGVFAPIARDLLTTVTSARRS